MCWQKLPAWPLREAIARANELALERGAAITVLDSGALGESAAEPTAVAEMVAARVAAGETKVALTASSKVLMHRCGLDAPRSVAVGSPRSVFLTALRQREELYSADAITIDTGEVSVAQVADRVLLINDRT